MKVEEARAIDFTGQIPGFRQFQLFDEAVIKFLRNGDSCTSLVIVDWAKGVEGDEALVVSDHLNLTGWSPLVGPNHASGPRFPVVNDIYVTRFQSGGKQAPEMKTVVAAGVKQGANPSADDLKLLRSLGADVYCYNVVPTMIVAAHAGLKVLAVLLPHGKKPKPELINLLTEEEE